MPLEKWKNCETLALLKICCILTTPLILSFIKLRAIQSAIKVFWRKDFEEDDGIDEDDDIDEVNDINEDYDVD